MILVLCTVNCTIFHGACPLNQPFVLPDLCNRQCIVLVNRIHIRQIVQMLNKLKKKKKNTVHLS